MVYYNKETEQFEFFPLKCMYFNSKDQVHRSHYALDKEYWGEFSTKWGYIQDLQWEDVVPTETQEQRLSTLNSSELCCGMHDSAAALYVTHGAVLPNPPEFLVDLYEVSAPETIAYVNDTFDESLSTLEGVEQFFLGGFEFE